jgi:hypothetical protein
LNGVSGFTPSRKVAKKEKKREVLVQAFFFASSRLGVRFQFAQASFNYCLIVACLRFASKSVKAGIDFEVWLNRAECK